MRRQKLVSEIYKHCEIIGANKTTMCFVLSLTTDRELTKFHKKFMEQKSYSEKQLEPIN